MNIHICLIQPYSLHIICRKIFYDTEFDSIDMINFSTPLIKQKNTKNWRDIYRSRLTTNKVSSQPYNMYLSCNVGRLTRSSKLCWTLSPKMFEFLFHYFWKSSYLMVWRMFAELVLVNPRFSPSAPSNRLHIKKNYWKTSIDKRQSEPFF